MIKIMNSPFLKILSMMKCMNPNNHSIKEGNFRDHRIQSFEDLVKNTFTEISWVLTQ